MKKLTADRLRNLKHGDTAIRWNGVSFRELRFVGLMPSCSNYLIFSDGEYLTHLYIDEKDNSFNADWYSGEYDSNLVAELMLDLSARRLLSTKTVYVDDIKDKLFTEDEKEAFVRGIKTLVKISRKLKSFESTMIEFAKYITNDTAYNDYWAMSDELQLEILNNFIEEQNETDKV